MTRRNSPRYLLIVALLPLGLSYVLTHRRGEVPRRSILRAEEGEPGVDVQKAWQDFKASRNGTLERVELPPDEDIGQQRRAFLRKEVVAGRDVVRPKFRSDVPAEVQREMDFASGVANPRNFAVLGSFVGVLLIFYIGVFFTGGITNGSLRYEPGFDGTTDSISDMLGAVLPTEIPIDSNDDKSISDLSQKSASSGPVV